MESWADGFQEYRHWATGGFLRLTRFRSSEKAIPILLADGFGCCGECQNVWTRWFCAYNKAVRGCTGWNGGPPTTRDVSQYLFPEPVHISLFGNGVLADGTK